MDKAETVFEKIAISVPKLRTAYVNRLVSKGIKAEDAYAIAKSKGMVHPNLYFGSKASENYGKKMVSKMNRASKSPNLTPELLRNNEEKQLMREFLGKGFLNYDTQKSKKLMGR